MATFRRSCGRRRGVQDLLYLSPDYYEALKLGEVLVAYGRVMMIGPGGSGKSSLRCSLMNKELPLLASSTLLADTYSVKYQWARGGDCEGEQGWLELTDDDEIDELASLLQMVVAFGATENPSSTHRVLPLVGLLTSVKDAVVGGIKLFHTDSAASQSPPTQVSEGKESAQEILKKVSSRLGRQRPRQHPQSEVLIRIWDCGGQLVFLNILPAFLTPRTLFMLTFDASVPLNNKAPVVTRQDGNVVRTEDHHLSTAELLLQWMASIHSHLSSKKPDRSPEQFPRIMLVGTHRDKLVDASCTSTSAEQDIRLELESRYNDKYYADLLLPSPLYFVDNTRAGKGKDEDPVAKKIRQSVHKFILEDLSVRTPVTWVLFRKVMERMFKDKPVVELREVRAIAKACLIPSEAVLNVLNFYHQLGVFLHFANIPGLHNVVITDPQWLIRNFAKVFATIEVEDQGMERMWKLLRSEGILVQRLYEKVLAGIEVEPQALIDLLSHFLLVAPIPPRRFHEYRDDKWYFVPSMLPEPSDDSDLPDGRAPEYKAETLHLAFASRYVPPGFFVRLIASLTHAKKRTVLLPCTDCRRVRFIYGSLDEFLVKESAESIELLLIRQHSTRKHDPSFNSTCQDVLQLLRDSIEDVRKWLPFEPNFAFKCAKCNVGFHVIAPTTAVLPCSRSECSQNFLSTVEHQYWLQCQPVHGIPNPEGDPGTPQESDVDEAECIGKSADAGGKAGAGPTVKKSEILTVDDFREVKAALHKARPQWRQLGVELGIPVDDLESFEMDGRNVEERLHNMLKAWLRKRSLRPTWERLVAALRAENVDREDIACDIAEEYLN